jgi:hypothetical protein
MNERELKISKIIGKRNIPGNTLIEGAMTDQVIIIDQPCELGYHCPVCKYEAVTDGNYDERLTWSEFNSFLWCYVCKKDYPSALCMPDIEKAVDIYLQSIQEAVQNNVARA